MKKIIFKLLFIISAFLILNSTFLIRNCQSQWSNYLLPYNGIAYTLGFYNINTGVSCGHTVGTFYEQLYYTSNSGVNWIIASYPLEIRALSDVQFINSTTVYACGAENIYNNFTKIYSPGFNFLPLHLRRKFISKGITEMYSEYKTAFLKSTNSGVNWVKTGVFDTLTGYMNNIHFFDANTGYALIDSNSAGNTRFYKTTNAGMNWQMIKLIEGGIELDNMYFFDLNTGFVGGYYGYGATGAYGVIYKTTNGGSSFVKTMFPGIDQIEDFTFLNSTTGIAIGFSETGMTKIYRTTNAGNLWDSIFYISDRMMVNIESVQSTGTAFAIGNVLDAIYGFGNIATIKTTNYGGNWIVKDINQNTIPTGLSLIDQNIFLMSGGDLNSYPSIARILKSTNGGVVFVNQNGNESPALYSLYQNYPNPFNPSTKISFQLPVVSSSSLKIFDITGKEVATIVNERLNAGTYRVDWNASEFPSGVYFYRLSAEGYGETKRMLLVK